MAPVLFYCEPEELHFHTGSPTPCLEACSMCQKPLDLNDDVFMYQGIFAFCSEECRERQIEIDSPPRRIIRPTYKPSASATGSAGQRWRQSSGAAAATTGGPVRTGVVTAA